MLAVSLTPPFGPDDTYWRMWRAVWDPTLGGVLNVEHDITYHDKVSRQLIECPADWCAAPYPYLDRPQQYGLGLVKFSAALIARRRSLWEHVGMLGDENHPPRHWCRLDAYSYQYLVGFGEERCEEHGQVGHVGHPGRRSSAHGCFTI